MFNTTLKAGNSSFLYWYVDIPIVYHESRRVLRNDTKKKKILPSTLSKEIGRNWPDFLESFSLDMWISSANFQLSAINFFQLDFRKSFLTDTTIPGQNITYGNHLIIYGYI